MTNRGLIDALETCIKLMDTGVPLEDCLANYPKFAPELKKLLETAQEINMLRVENIPTNAVDQSRMKLLSRVEGLRIEKEGGSRNKYIGWFVEPIRYFIKSLRYLNPFARRLAVSLGIVALLLLFSGGLLITSAKSLPGDSLYPVKIAVEDIKVSLASNMEIRHDYEVTYNQKRVEEVQQLIGLSRAQQISFEGIINSMDDSHWNVSGISVVIQPGTKIISGANGTDLITPGMEIEVEGSTSSQGWVLADEIHLREYQFIGIVEEINAYRWQVSGTPLIITKNSQIDPGIQVGDEVIVLVRSEDNGIFALAILQELNPKATITPSQPVEDAPMVLDESTIESEKRQTLEGILEQVTGNYWKINGENFYLIGNTSRAEDINIGDPVSVTYIVEANGSFTAIKIERSEESEETKENDPKETPEENGDSDDHSSKDATSDEEEKDRTKTPEPTKKPEPTETPQPTEDH
jgi:hypothetical protein